MRLLHALFLALGVAACMPAWCAEPAVVRIGVSTPLTNGPRPDLGANVRDGAQMAVDDLDAQGVRIGDAPVKLELFTVDDHSDPGQAPATARALADAHVAGVVGPLNSGIALRAATTFAQAGLPTITPSATHPGPTRMGLANTFRLQPDDAALVFRLVAWAAHDRPLKHLALVTEASGYGQVMALLFKAASHAAGIELDEIKLEPNAANVTAVVKELRAERPDAVLVAAMDTTGASLAREMRAQATWFTLIGPDGFCSPSFALQSGGLKPGQVLCARQGLHAPEASPELAAFDERFTQRFGRAPDAEDNCAVYAYEAVRVLVAAMADAGSSDPAVYMSHIRRTSLKDSLVGPFHFDERGDVPDGVIALFTYDGTSRVYKSPLP